MSHPLRVRGGPIRWLTHRPAEAADVDHVNTDDLAGLERFLSRGR